ncbi:MAG: ATP-binding protein [Clostridiales bacterium]|nr:ATP-binding protein [Clostridiales bacterium]
MKSEVDAMSDHRLMPPIGIEDFKEIREDGFYYVDKTGLIRELLENKAKVTLFTRPRRFGKTLTMSMLRRFFEIGADPALFDGMAISRERELCEAHMGQYPVISLSLKDVDGMDFEGARKQLAAIVAEQAGRLSVLRNSDRISEAERQAYSDLEFRTGDLENSLRNLSKMLYKHYGQKAVILIDEYDVPLDKANEGGFYDEMVKLIRLFLSGALKTNEYLQLAVLTGCLRVSKESIFTGLNNLKVYSVQDQDYDEWFGFTEEEVQDMLAYFGVEDRMDETRNWYDGYRFGNADVYCPWDVVNWCGDLRRHPDMRPQNYWANSSGNGIIRKFADMADEETRDEMEGLLKGRSVTKTYKGDLTYRELYDEIDNVWSMLLTTGYLTCRKQNDDGTCEMSITNREIADVFRKEIEQWFKSRVKGQAKAGRYEDLYQALEDGDAAYAEGVIQDCLMESMSFMDGGKTAEQKEAFYHGMLLGIFTGCQAWLVKSNREAGKGRADIIATMRSTKTGIIVEVKRTDDPDGIDALAETALAQIGERDYSAYFQRANAVDTLRKYGIAFCGKECRVAV